jgi:hypothetical protein
MHVRNRTAKPSPEPRRPLKEHLEQCLEPTRDKKASSPCDIGSLRPRPIDPYVPLPIFWGSKIPDAAVSILVAPTSQTGPEQNKETTDVEVL